MGYVLTLKNLSKLKNQREAKWIYCQTHLKERSRVVTLDVRHRYCYKCAPKRNLIFVNVTKDTHSDKSFRETISCIKTGSKKIWVNESIESFTLKIIKESFTYLLNKSKGLIGLICSAIFVVTTLSGKKDLNEIRGQLCTNFNQFQKNFWTAKYIFINSKLMEKFYGTYL